VQTARTSHAAWFTDSQQAQLYKLPIGSGGALPEPDAIEVVPLSGSWMQQPGFNANGIAETPNHQALLVIQSNTGILFRVDPETGVVAVVVLGGVVLANGDGLLVVGRTLYVVQNQVNTVAVVRLDAAGTSGELVDQRTDPAFQVPTTIAKFGNGRYLPNARFDTPLDARHRLLGGAHRSVIVARLRAKCRVSTAEPDSEHVTIQASGEHGTTPATL